MMPPPIRLQTTARGRWAENSIQEASEAELLRADVVEALSDRLLGRMTPAAVLKPTTRYVVTNKGA